ncbi:MAG: hypothetical protein ACOH5I_22060 [Oligoflexus sp.]
MKLSLSLLLILCSAFFVLLGGCQDNSFERKPPAAASIDAAAEDYEINDEEPLASEPISVAGAFLSCAIDPTIEVSSEENSGLGCRLTDENNKPIVLPRNFEVTTTLIKADGTSREIPPSPITSIYWHWVYESPTRDLVGGSITMTSNAEGVLWGEAKTVVITEADNNLQNQLDLVYAMIAEHEASVANLQVKVDESTKKRDQFQKNETQAKQEKDSIKIEMDNLKIEYKNAKVQYDQAMSAANSAMDQLAVAEAARLQAAADLETAADVQAAEARLADAVQKEAEAQQILDNAIISRDNAKIQMDSEKADFDTAKGNHNNMIGIHTTAVVFLQRANKVLEEDIAALEKVTDDLEALRAEAERLKAELEKQ